MMQTNLPDCASSWASCLLVCAFLGGMGRSGPASAQKIGIQAGIHIDQFRFASEDHGGGLGGTSIGTISDPWGFHFGATFGFKSEKDSSMVIVGLGYRQTRFHAVGSGQAGPFEFEYERFVRTSHLAFVLAVDLRVGASTSLQPGIQIGIPFGYRYTGTDFRASYQTVETEGPVDVRDSGSPYSLHDLGLQVHLCQRLGPDRSHGSFLTVGAYLGLTSTAEGEWKTARPMRLEVGYGYWLKRRKA